MIYMNINYHFKAKTNAKNAENDFILKFNT